jgi:hypothetical protein
MIAMSRRRWWLAGTVAVLVAGTGAGVIVWQHVRAHLPTVSVVTPVLDRGIANVVTAVGDSAAVTVTGLVPARSCGGGSIFTVTANLYTNPGTEGAVIDRIAAAIPAGDAPRRSAAFGGGAPSLYASLGDGVQLQVIQLDHGWISATATSGCRSAARPAAAPLAPAAATVALGSTLHALGSAPTAFHADAVTCASGQIVTTSTASEPLDLADLPVRLAKLPPPSATVYASPSDRISWRQGSVSTVISAADDGTHVTAQQTVTC